MSSLSKSRWAPSSDGPQKSSYRSDRGDLLSAPEELSRFMKIVARLKWKLPFLAEGYRLATLHDPAALGIDIAQAEIMFKLDFHEYYALLERALVHLLAVFGITVSGKNKKRAGSHSYHANVLEALEARTCPLRSALGSGERINQLKRAKELRNRWKTADDDECQMPLDSYDLEKIIAEVFDGLEDGYRLAEGHAKAYETPDYGREASSLDWDFIVDAMDWEAV
ncbi:hypothetical protein BDV18DRAFT_161665 [Aspergillus unguis]